jgi:hypothetical protein
MLDLLDVLFDPAVAANRLVVVRGDSTSGKSRAAFEAATHGRLAGWRLEYPHGEPDLGALLDTGIPARTIVWLRELPDYTAGPDDGAAVLGRLSRLLEQHDHLVVVTTMWPQHWDTYTGAARTRTDLRKDQSGTAGRLLSRQPCLTGSDPATIDPARGGVIDIPVTFTPAEVTAAARADPLLADAAQAAASAGQDGQITQYLAGVPDLLNRLDGPGDPYGQAVILAAMDAARLGCESPLPAAFLIQAAAGYLTSQERTLDPRAWAGPALAWATEKLKGAVQAVQPVPYPHGAGTAGYRSADYLDQHSRSTRAHEIGTADLWDAFTAHIEAAADLNWLGDTADEYGLHRHAALLWTKATDRGSSAAAASLIAVLRYACPQDVIRAGHWTAARASLDNPQAVAKLLYELSAAGATDAVTALLARDPAAHASLDNPRAVGSLLGALHQVGATEAVTALLARDSAAHASLDDAEDVGSLLSTLREVGAAETFSALANRAATHVRLDDPGAVADILDELDEAGATEAVSALLARDPAAHASLNHPWGVGGLMSTLRQVGAKDAAAALLARDPAAYASLDNPTAVASLLSELRTRLAVLPSELRCRTEDAITALANDVAAHVRLDAPTAHWAVPYLLDTLRRTLADDAFTAFANRAAAHVRLDNPLATVDLVESLSFADATGAIAILATRAAAHTPLDIPYAVRWLLHVLARADATDAVADLTARADGAGIPRSYLAAQASFLEDPTEWASHAPEPEWYGREPEGTPSQPWTWQEPQ